MANIQQNPLILDDFSRGVLRNLSPYKMPAEAVPHAVNFVFDENIGEATLRKGTAMVGAQIVNNKAVLGLANFRSRSTANHALLAVVSDGTNNDIYKATTWAKSLADDTKALKTRFAQFLDSIVRVNGTDARKSFNGTAWVSTGGVFDLANMPQGKYVVNFKDRVHVMDENGTLYSSSVPRFFLDYDAQGSNFTVDKTVTGGTSKANGIIKNDTDAGAAGTLELIGVAGTFTDNETITDDNSTPGSADVKGTGSWKLNWLNGTITTPIDPDNGDKGKATGFGVVGGLLLIFFERAMYSWNGSTTEADKIVDIGCSSQESVVVIQGVCFFANSDGVFATRGGYPQKISRFVQDYFDNMSSANYQHIASGGDGQHLFVSIGDVTIKKKLVANVVLRYTVQSQEQAILSYPSQPRVFSKYIDTNDVKLVYGDDDGNVIQIDSSDENDNYASTTDYPIVYEIDTRDIFEPLKGAYKSIASRIVVNSTESSGAKLLARIDSDIEADFKSIGEIKKEIQEFKNIPIEKFRYARFRIAGRSKAGRLSLQAIEIPNWRLLGY